MREVVAITCNAKTKSGPCKRRAGEGTSHPGRGRCSTHGGNRKPLHGRSSIHLTGTLGEKRDEIEKSVQVKSEFLGEMDALRAIAWKYVEEQGKHYDALIAWYEEDDKKPTKLPNFEKAATMLLKVIGAADKLHQQERRDAMPMDTFFRVQEAMAAAVKKAIMSRSSSLPDGEAEDMIAEIGKDWGDIRI